MTKTEKTIKSLLSKIEISKNKVAKERDLIRELHGELEGLLESWDAGIENIEFGSREILNGIDSLSELV